MTTKNITIQNDSLCSIIRFPSLKQIHLAIQLISIT